MTRTIGLSALVVALLLAWKSYAVWSMLQTCSAKARAIIAAADLLDRNPPEQLASIIERNIQLDRLVDYLSTMLLDRYACRGGPSWRGTEWLIDQPSLAWHLRTTFGKTEVIGLFAATADVGKGDIGLSRSARKIYGRDTSLLDDDALHCLVNKALGKPTLSTTPDHHHLVCTDGVPPPPAMPAVIPRPGETWSRPDL
jgi:hypothetical protein